MAFRGIPYAAAPVGRLRFAPPSPPLPWTGLREAVHPGPIAPQTPTPLDQLLGISGSDQSEDCLSLNVWTPSLEGRRPVMVFVHGGAFLTGSGSAPWYAGTRLAERHDVVVVTFNYRLGALGFSYFGSAAGERFAASANAGLLDQVAVLAWVRDHASAFGGSADDVCVFGESAGAMSIGALLGMPAAAGLFRRAILQSGACANVADPEQSARRTAALFDALGMDAARPEALLEVPAERILAAQQELAAAAGGGLPYLPVVDGITLPEPPLAALARGSRAPVELLVGTNLEELQLFGAFDRAEQALTEDQLVARAHAAFGSRAEAMLSVYRDGRPGSAPVARWSAMLGDQTFRIPAIRLAEHHARAGGKGRMYLFTWRSQAFGGLLGACHAMELPFVFDAVDRPGVELFTGSGPGRRELADLLSTAWTAFARSGEPKAPGLPEWPLYDELTRSTMRLDVPPSVVEDPYAAERRLWDGLA